MDELWKHIVYVLRLLHSGYHVHTCEKKHGRQLPDKCSCAPHNAQDDCISLPPVLLFLITIIISMPVFAKAFPREHTVTLHMWCLFLDCDYHLLIDPPHFIGGGAAFASTVVLILTERKKTETSLSGDKSQLKHFCTIGTVDIISSTTYFLLQVQEVEEEEVMLLLLNFYSGQLEEENRDETLTINPNRNCGLKPQLYSRNTTIPIHTPHIHVYIIIYIWKAYKQPQLCVHIPWLSVW